MKLLSTIAFLLLTLSAFSQEKLSYQDGVIKQGEEVLSLNDFSILLSGEQITARNVRLAQKQRWAAQSAENTTLSNAGILLTAVLIEYPSMAIAFLGAWSGSTPAVLVGLTGMYQGVILSSKMTTSFGFEMRAEKNLITAVRKYNKKIEGK
jgi:hypothetical protein